MNTPGLITALLLPALLGISWLQLLWRDSHLAARIGYGYLLGIFAVTTILRIWGSFGLSLTFLPISTLIIVLSLVPLLQIYRIKPNSTVPSRYTPYDASWQKVVWGLLLSILIIRYGGVLFELIWRPLYPWDAWMNWAPKARLWLELQDLISFVHESDWILQNPQNNAYTIRAYTYPPVVPLILTWTALGTGSWIDNVVNIPWILCLIALGLAFYGQGRMLGAKPHTVMLMLFLLLSIPYINTHTALAGYAELWLGAFFCLAGMAFINWSQTRDTKQALLCIIFAVACTQTKNPGMIWAALFVPASLFVLIPKHWGYLLIGVVFTSIFLFFFLGGISLHIDNIGELALTTEKISLPGLGTFPLTYHPIGHMFGENILIRGNFHLLGWLILILTIPLSIKAICSHNLLAANILVLLSASFLYIVFFFTFHYKAALDNTTINRAIFHFTPLLVFYILFLGAPQKGKSGSLKRLKRTPLPP